MAIAFIMALSPSAFAAHAAALPGSLATYDLTVGAGGCGKVHAPAPTYSAKTGIGKWAGTDTVPCASKGVGGVGANNYAQSDATQYVYIPIAVTSSNTGANVSVSLVGTWSEAITGKLGTSCPTSSTYNSSYYYTYYASWVNSTTTYGNCALEASVQIGGEAYLIDSTTGSQYYDYYTYWAGVSHLNEQTASSDFTVQTWSNPLYYGNNYTSYYTSGTIRGSNAAGSFVASQNPTWWFNTTQLGFTFSNTDHYYLEAYIYADVYASTDGATKGSATAAVNLGGATNGLLYSYATY